MLKVAICDDEQPIREYLQKLTEQCMTAEVSVFGNGEALLNSKTPFDIVLLDISLNREGEGTNLNGVEVARQFRRKSDVIIIFITALREYVFDGYDVGAFHYLLKPLNEQKFREVMEKAVSQLQKKTEETLMVKMGGSYVNIPVSNIVYAENTARKITLYVKDMVQPCYTFYEKMENLEKSLGEGFFRSHRGFLVNLAEVSGYDHTGITMKNGAVVYLAKAKYHDFVAAYMNYLRRE